MHDLIIRGGSVVDGTGAKARLADVAIDNGVITAVGIVKGEAKREIDARGLLVTPGFVDIHTHYDGQVTWDSYLTPSCWHGVTTIIMGNCGVGFAPAKPDKHEWLIELMEGVEDIPGTALAEGMRWNWESFPQYLDSLEKMTYVMDVAAQVPHAAVRAYVMGERGARDEQATPEDISEMARIVGEGVAAGAVGFSTSRTALHRAKGGGPVPGTNAAIAELYSIGEAMARAGRAVFEVVAEIPMQDADVSWISDLSLKTKLPITFVLVQSSAAPDAWRNILVKTGAARAKGADITAQVGCRPAGLVIGWQSTFHPFINIPAYKEIAHLPFPERLAKLKEPARRDAIINAVPAADDVIGQMMPGMYDYVFRLGRDSKDNLNYEPNAEDSFTAIAAREGKTPSAMSYDAFMENEGTGYIYMTTFNYADRNFDAIHDWLMDPSTVVGLSDGGAHCGVMCDASSPTYMLTHWARDRERGALLTLEDAVRMQTQDTARLYGLSDRGVIAPGMKADLNVIDLKKLKITEPEMVFDLPANGRRMIQRAEGYRATIVSGVVTFENGEATGELPGKLVRGMQSAPSLRAAE